MDGRAGIPLLLVGAALMVTGVALGSSTQHETFLGENPEELAKAGSSLVVLTAFLVGLGGALVAVALGRASVLRRVQGAVAVALGGWALVALLQSDFPNYDALAELEIATLSISALLVEDAGAPTVLLPVLASGTAALGAVLWGVQRCVRTRPALASLAAQVRAQRAWTLFAAPWLLVSVAGCMRVLLDLPDDEPGLEIAYVLLPIAAAACLGLLTVLFVRAWRLSELMREGRLLPFTREEWRTLARIELPLVGVLLATALASGALPTLSTDATAVGRTLVLTVRAHGQGLAFLAVPLVPLLALHRRIGVRLAADGIDVHPDAGRGILGATIVTGASALLVLATSFAPHSLLPWTLAFLPPAIFAAVTLPPWTAFPLQAVTAWTLWARGNSVAAGYDASRFPPFDFLTHPGVLALWRMLGAAVLAWALYRLMRHVGAGQRSAVVVPLSLATAIGATLIALLEVPLGAWTESRLGVDKVAVGSIIQSQPEGVQVVALLFSFVAGLGAAVAMARLVRPDWFPRRGRAVPTTASLDGATGVPAR